MSLWKDPQRDVGSTSENCQFTASLVGATTTLHAVKAKAQRLRYQRWLVTSYHLRRESIKNMTCFRYAKRFTKLLTIHLYDNMYCIMWYFIRVSLLLVSHRRYTSKGRKKAKDTQPVNHPRIYVNCFFVGSFASLCGQENLPILGRFLAPISHRGAVFRLVRSRTQLKQLCLRAKPATTTGRRSCFDISKTSPSRRTIIFALTFRRRPIFEFCFECVLIV